MMLTPWATNGYLAVRISDLALDYRMNLDLRNLKSRGASRCYEHLAGSKGQLKLSKRASAAKDPCLARKGQLNVCF